DESGCLTPLGKYFLYSTNFVKDFFKLIMLNDKDFCNFIIELDENKVKFEKLHDNNYLSRFFRVVPISLMPFFISIGLIIEGTFNMKLIKSWNRQIAPISERISNIFLNILNKINPSDFDVNKKKVINKFNEGQNLKHIIDEENVELIINFEEFEDFNQKLHNFFNTIDINPNIEDSLFPDLDNYDPIHNKQEIEPNPSRKKALRSRFLRNIIVSLYNDCQICAAITNKIPRIIMKNNDIYLEVHHIIPISKQNDSEQWINYYSINSYFE
ncbi:unnamed protein product, partial [marine sediment metagenome]